MKSTKKTTLELVSKFNKVEKCKVNIQKSVVFLYINKKQLQLKSKRIPFTRSKTMKYTGIHKQSMHETCTLKTTKHCCEKLKI